MFLFAKGLLFDGVFMHISVVQLFLNGPSCLSTLKHCQASLSFRLLFVKIFCFNCDGMIFGRKHYDHGELEI